MKYIIVTLALIMSACTLNPHRALPPQSQSREDEIREICYDADGNFDADRGNDALDCGNL